VDGMQNIHACFFESAARMRIRSSSDKHTCRSVALDAAISLRSAALTVALCDLENTLRASTAGIDHALMAEQLPAPQHSTLSTLRTHLEAHIDGARVLGQPVKIVVVAIKIKRVADSCVVRHVTARSIRDLCSGDRNAA